MRLPTGGGRSSRATRVLLNIDMSVSGRSQHAQLARHPARMSPVDRARCNRFDRDQQRPHSLTAFAAPSPQAGDQVFEALRCGRARVHIRFSGSSDRPTAHPAQIPQPLQEQTQNISFGVVDRVRRWPERIGSRGPRWQAARTSLIAATESNTRRQGCHLVRALGAINHSLECRDRLHEEDAPTRAAMFRIANRKTRDGAYALL